MKQEVLQQFILLLLRIIQVQLRQPIEVQQFQQLDLLILHLVQAEALQLVSQLHSVQVKILQLDLALAEVQQQHIILVHLPQLHIQLLLKLLKIQLLLLQQQEVHNCKKQIKVQQQYIQQHLIQVL